MSYAFALLITEKWLQIRGPLKIPRHGYFKRPRLSRVFVAKNQSVKNWLIEQGYCTELKPATDPEPPAKFKIQADSTLALPTDAEAELTGDQLKLLTYLQTHTAQEVAEEIKGVSLTSAKRLKASEPLTWDDVNDKLSERSLSAALKFISTSSSGN
jgi:hypothetical protein